MVGLGDGLCPYLLALVRKLEERCLRRAVVWRKKCFGTDSEGGSRLLERILSVVTTLRERDVVGCVCAVRVAAVQGQPAPNLVSDP